MLYVYPKLSQYDFGILRIIGPGLGNLLFPWARAIVAARRFSLACLFPTWPQVKIGSIVRRERDTRFYANLFQRSNGYIGGIRRLQLLATSERFHESRLPDLLGRENRTRNSLVVFEGMARHFLPILSHHQLVHRELLQIARADHKRALRHGAEQSISLHVRLGDFLAASRETLISGRHNYRIPLTWYVAQVAALRARLGPIPAHVFSDGEDHELTPLLKLPDVSRVSFGSGLADLLALSQSRILIASGSTFSMWASYLGRMPVVWHPGQLRQRLYLEAHRELEAEGLPDYPDSFLEAAADRLASTHAA